MRPSLSTCLPALLLALSLVGCGAPQAPAIPPPVSIGPGAGNAGVEPVATEAPELPAPGSDGSPAVPAAAQTPDTSASPGASLGGASERVYIDALLPAVENGLLILDRVIAEAAKPELKALATRLKPEFAARLQALKAQRLASFGSDVVPGAEKADLSYLQPGPDLDWMLADELHRAIEAGLDASNEAKPKPIGPELKAIAEAVTQDWPALKTQLNDWVNAWLVELYPEPTDAE